MAITIDRMPLPAGFEQDRSMEIRRVYLKPPPTDFAYAGLAQAVIMQALRDGCNREWVEDLMQEFPVNLPREFLVRMAAQRECRTSYPRRIRLNIDMLGVVRLTSLFDAP